ncbi:MAG: SCP2 sterol-binding domain-containing protein [Actinobacteria bacterium]|nr:MAG: SCP2 sterol-binding domain-containing protein [Actinomycetota bacterium]TMM14457.1 MAG: SCP2 sterol-binding domain-containing protein [Actinomycetota bacterium]
MSASMMPPEQFASLISDASDEQLAEGMASNREPILEEIFKRMPDQFDPAKAPDVTAVIEWQITGGPDGSTDRWQLAIKDGKCTCARGGDAQPDVTYTVGPVDFVKLIAGAESGPKLFVFGKLRIRGNLMLAARVQGFFRMPSAASPS